jgi:hypothetical protein
MTAPSACARGTGTSAVGPRSTKTAVPVAASKAILAKNARATAAVATARVTLLLRTASTRRVAANVAKSALAMPESPQ